MNVDSLYSDYNAITPVYERASSAITLGLIGRWRRLTIRLGLKALGNCNAVDVLDAVQVQAT
jgi:hypothetical protein